MNARWLVPVLLSLASCGGLAHTLRSDVPKPLTIAVLPCSGDADPATRDLLRGLLAARFADLGYRVAEVEFVDRVLAEGGWLADPATFAVGSVPLDAVAARIGTDGVVAVDGLDESRFNILLYRRHSLAAQLRLVERDGREWWTARHSVASTGGFLLQSGQLLTELRAQGMHGNSAATLALVDALVEDVTGTLPRAADAGVAPAAPMLQDLAIDRRDTRDGVRLTVHATTAAAASVAFDCGERASSMPMAGRDGVFTGAIDLPAGSSAGVRVRARNAFGGEQHAEVAK